ncbi:MAG: hypothetical protein A2445_03980 [Candidatus Jacksonbacteria bacterium RIFOXYC2_FULL_44_29]|nr:MAG: RNA polymerase, sigma-24 subunit, ECF subfamily [Parcubacteria group bacterium GW2011_GWA2_42_28]KKT56253.1 MAG: RNA polymerase, sigma-24 subunit, ECF subfamily [Parcubacteria group bacterium GW2011_GWC2_44_22]OGY76099.1 MAG: hypothetical protein A2240_00200 [Candidatus Jacksonbacteria bacterium RIFOXYA2_FULL_43_12]OGY77690.1 MAG: hypothetical protein A2295_02700 [Candidatus Jacksonbacteria bacterium RIFOXYB2_FULL_44_15]OGY78826.1 MAG: hypothetical protein A2550_04765 [Candidatus Jackso
MSTVTTDVSSDAQLIKKYLKGDEKSLELLIRSYLQPIYSFVYRYLGNATDVEDVTQEVFVRVWRNLKKFDTNKPFKTWLFSIAKNAAIDWQRKKKLIPFSDFETENGDNPFLENIPDPAPLPSELLARADLALVLNEAMDQLPVKQKMTLFLRYNDHFTFREIAESLGEPLNTVKNRHLRALIALKKIIGEK